MTLTRGISRAQVVRNAAAYAEHGTDFGVGMCLYASRSAAQADGGIKDAVAAWGNSQHKHKHSQSIPPRGTFVFYGGGSKGHGHVTVSDGNGWEYSTDLKRRGKVDRVRHTDLMRAWGKTPARPTGLTYLGYAEDINGVWPTFKPARAVRLSRMVESAKHDTATFAHNPRQVRRVQRKLGMKVTTGRWREGTKTRWARLYPGTHGMPTAHSLADFANRHNLRYLEP